MDNKMKITVDGKTITIRFCPERMKFEYNYGYKDNLGKRQSRILRADSIEELKQSILLFKQSIISSDINSSNVTFNNYIDYYINNVSRINNRISSTRRLLNSLSKIPKDILNQPLNQLSTQQLQQVYTNLYKTLSRNSVKSIHMSVDIILNYAVENNIIKTNPNKKCKVLGFCNGKKEYISPQQAKEFLSFLKDHPKYYVLYKPVLLYLTTGVRRGEGLGLKKSCVNPKNHTILIKGQICCIECKSQYVDYLKTESSIRTIQLSKEVFDIITDYTGNDTEFVFCNRRGKVWNYMTFAYTLKRAFREFGLPNMSTKHFRNSFVKTAILNNVPLKIIQQILGHSKQSTTADIYGELLDSDAFMISDVMQNVYQFGNT